jgi:hypothetical protein
MIYGDASDPCPCRPPEVETCPPGQFVVTSTLHLTSPARCTCKICSQCKCAPWTACPAGTVIGGPANGQFDSSARDCGCQHCTPCSLPTSCPTGSYLAPDPSNPCIATYPAAKKCVSCLRAPGRPNPCLHAYGSILETGRVGCPYGNTNIRYQEGCPSCVKCNRRPPTPYPPPLRYG